MPSTIFCYALNGDHKIKDFFSIPSHDLPAYVRFTIALKAYPARPLHTIITNACGCGRWLYDEKTGTYKQTRGTMQYRIPQSEQGIRKALRAEYRDLLREKRDFTVEGLTDEQAQILDVLEGN